MDTKDFMALTYEEKIGVITEDPREAGLPEEARYVAQYLEQYRPGPRGSHPDNESSLDIVETLETMCELGVGLVSKVMWVLGYRVYFQGVSTPVWCMRHTDDDGSWDAKMNATEE